MLTPTHIQVAVLRTKNLISKGKNGTNDAFIIYSLGKEKFQSSVKEKASDSILTWNEGCDIPIPASNGNKAELVLKVMHKAAMGDKFLGRVALLLSDFDVSAKAKPVWYSLKPKPGSEKDTKSRGEIEVRISFLIKSNPNLSTNDLSKSKRSGSFKSSLGSILSLGKSKKKKKDKDGSKSSRESLGGNSSTDSLRKHSNNNLTSSRLNLNNNLPIINDDPGVISEEEEEEEIEEPVERKAPPQRHQSLPQDPVGQKGSTGSVISGSIHNESVPSTPKSIGKSKLREDTPPATPPTPRVQAKPPVVHVHHCEDNDEAADDDVFDPQPKPRTVRLPSVIVEESPSLTGLNSGSEDSNKPRGGFSTLPRQAAPPSANKLAVSASMSNLLDPSHSGKGSVRKTVKSMFSSSSSKRLSVDQLFHPSSSSQNIKQEAENDIHGSQHLTGGFFMRRRSSVRDLGIPKETYKLFEKKSKEELVAIILDLQATVNNQKQKIGDMEDYIDKLLLRVLDNMPVLLKKQGSVRAKSEIN